MTESFYPDYVGYVGTTSTRGICRIGVDASSCEIRVLETRPMYNSGYLTLSGDRKNLYVLSEGMTFQGMAAGGITAFAVGDGKFEEQNHAVTGGQRPCYVCCDDKSGEIYISNFFNGTMDIFERREDGSLGKRRACIAHPKTEPVGPFLHCVEKSPGGRYLAALELIGGSVFLYDCGKQYETIWQEVMEPHSGPRHLTFSEDGKFLYVNRQGDEKVSVYAFEPEAEKKLSLIQTISVRTPDMKGRTEPAAIRLCPGGRLLAVSNRGIGSRGREDSITLFDVNPESGYLTGKRVVKTTGEMPRDCNFTPDGKFLVTGYQFQNYLDLYRVTDEGLVYLSSSGRIQSPVCIVF